MKVLLRRLIFILRPALTRRFFYGYAYNIFCRYFKLRQNRVLLESHHGKGFWGSPYALTQYMVQQRCFDDWLFVLVAPRHQHTQLRSIFPNTQLRFVKIRSFRYAWYLATSKWLVNDNTFPFYFNRRKEQSYLNLWHGTPLKTLGRHVKNEVFRQLVNVQRNFLHATHLLVPNPHTESILEEAYMLPGLWRGTMLRCGYPSNEVLVTAKNTVLSKNHINIAFMPTWRGTLATCREASNVLLDELRELLKRLDATLNDNAVLWVRLHPMVSGLIDFDHYNKVKGFPYNISPYEHLAKCHILITDYSSVLFDFLLTSRPIVLHVPDKGEYLTERGFYIDPQTLPFPKTTNVSELISLIDSLCKNLPEPSEEYQSFQGEYGIWDSEKNCSKICASFFGRPVGLESSAIKVHTVEPEKRPILLYAGAMVPNGITRSFMTLVGELGQVDRCFVILADTSVQTEEIEPFFCALPSNVKFVPLQLNLHITPVEMMRSMLLYAFKIPVRIAPPYLVSVWEREVRRLFGAVDFEAFVNFNGYSWRSALMALGANWKRIVYVHNDMAKEVAVGKLLDPRLLELSYRCADTVALVREGGGVEYCHQFYDYSLKARYVPNCLRTDIPVLAEEPLYAAFSGAGAGDALKRALELLAASKMHRFINLARFADEKGQLRLIDAFEKVHAKYPHTQLFIMGGYGPREEAVRDRAADSDYKDSIVVVRGSNNPFPLVKCCDTLVLSSFYEGLPLTLIEAIQCGLQVLSTDIPGPSELLSQGYGTLVDNSIEGIEHGMLLALEGNIARQSFDIPKHNTKAVAAFMSLFEE